MSFGLRKEDHMDSINNFRERFEALEHRTEGLARQLRLWRGIACGLLILSLMGLPLPGSHAQDDAREDRGVLQRLEALEYKLVHITSGPDDVTITGANLRIVNGLGTTDTTNGVGNLIVGYNESRQGSTFCPPVCTDTRTGSHNVVVGRRHNFSSFGGSVVGDENEISGEFSSVIAGFLNMASGSTSSVSGGQSNTASGLAASVGGGFANTASGALSWVSGDQNTASGASSSVSGGFINTASGLDSSVSGGEQNTASGDFSSVSGGNNRTASGQFNWAAGPLFADH
jgi:trimeric autotransporter adhesin